MNVERYFDITAVHFDDAFTFWDAIQGKWIWEDGEVRFGANAETWVTATGEKVPIKKMNTPHLVNAIKLMRRKCSAQALENSEAFAGLLEELDHRGIDEETGRKRVVFKTGDRVLIKKASNGALDAEDKTGVLVDDDNRCTNGLLGQPPIVRLDDGQTWGLGPDAELELLAPPQDVFYFDTPSPYDLSEVQKAAKNVRIKKKK